MGLDLKRKSVGPETNISKDDFLEELDVDEDYNDSSDDEFNDATLDEFTPDALGDDFGSMGMSTMDKHSDLLKEIMDFESYIKQVVNGWLGLAWDETRSKFVKDPLQEPIMNKQCAVWCGNTLRTYARSNNVITTINADIYNEIMMDIGRSLIINIRSRSEEFGIKNQGDAGTIINQMLNTVKLMLSGVVNNKMADVIKTTVNRQENVVLRDNEPQQTGQVPIRNSQPKNKGALGFLNKLING